MVTELLMKNAEGRVLLLKTTITVFEEVIKKVNALHQLDCKIIFKGGNVFRAVVTNFWEKMEHKDEI